MRRKLFMLSLVATIVAVSCDSDKKNVPAPDDGENKPTTYCDVLLPDEGFGRDEMVWLLELVEEQEGEIDDALFVEKLHTTFFDCADGYYVSGEPKQWMWAALVDGGGDMLGTIYFDDDGTYVSRVVFLSTFTGDEVGERMLRDGYAGWYSRNDWHYESESNTLITSFEGYELRAEVLYCDEDEAVLRGHIGGFSLIAYDDDGAHIAFDNELFLIFFGEDGRDTFLDACSLTKDEFMALYEEYANEQ